LIKLIQGLLLLAALAAVCLTTPANAEKASDFRAERLDGGKFRLAEALGKEILLVHFFDTCCPGCREGLPFVDSTAAAFPKDVRVILVSTDSPKSQSKLKPFIKSNRYKYEVLLDPNLEIRKLFGGVETPFSLVLQPTGDIAWRKVGAAPDDFQAMTRVIQELITPNLHK